MRTAAATAAAERLAVLARTNEALETAAQIPLASKPNLASLERPASEAGGGGATAKPFTDADLPTLKMCRQKNGSRWILGGGSAGQVIFLPCPSFFLPVFFFFFLFMGHSRAA